LQDEIGDDFECSDDWEITGSFTPIESDFPSQGQSEIEVQGVGRKYFKSEFLTAVKEEGSGKTHDGWYLGYHDDDQKWYKNSFPLTYSGQRLKIGDVAVDPQVISIGSLIRTPTLPTPWNEMNLTANDIGLKGKEITIYIGEGKEAEQEAIKITGEDEKNKHVCFQPQKAKR